MWLTIKHPLIIVAAFALLPLVFRLGIYIENSILRKTADESADTAALTRAEERITAIILEELIDGLHVVEEQRK
jgi:hypothetical protein